MLISIVLIAIFAIGAVSAADENITDAADEILSAEPADEVLSTEPAEELEVEDWEDFSGLVGLIKNTSSGQTLKLEKNYVNDGTYTKGILISKKMTIDGQGHTLDANYKSNIFRISNTQVVLKNINFINSYTKDYSAVYGNCTVINCTFTDCNTEKNGGAIYNGTAYNCSFSNCKASSESRLDYYSYYSKLPPYCQGGAIYNGDAYNCYFENCSADFFYYHEFYSGMDSHETWDNSGRGGAISNGNAYNCSFIKCNAYRGGAIYNGNATNCYFGNCNADRPMYPSGSYCGGNGGSILKGNANNCSFTNCYAEDGGAIKEGSARNCLFINCSALWAGAIRGINKDMNDAYNCSFINCYAKNHGGALYLCRAHDCSFINCSSSEGGAMYTGYASNCSFTNCQANSYKVGSYENGGDGGAIYGGYYQRSASDCTFINCSSSKRGGAIYGGDAYNSRFLNCTSKNNEIITKGNSINCFSNHITLSCSDLSVNFNEGGILPIRTVEGINGMTVNVKVYKDSKLLNSFPSTTGSDLPIDAAPGNYILALSCDYADPLNVSLVVNKGSPKMSFATDFVKSGETANVKVTMSKKAAGYVRITINGETYRVQIKSGSATAEVPNLADGIYNVTATYGGNTYHTAETITGTFQAGKIKQGMTLETNNIKVGETERLTATLAKDATGFVRFIIGDDTYKVAIENGVAYADIDNLKAGTYSVTLKYAGNYRYNAETLTKTFTVVKSSPGITITKEPTYTYVGNDAIIKVRLAEDAPGNVLITVNGESHKVKINNGIATLRISGLKEGTYNISAKYAGNYKYNAEIKTTSFNVNKAVPGMGVTAKTENGKTIITASISRDAPGNLRITYEGVTYTEKITNGLATLIVDGIIPGSHLVEVKYAGNYKYQAATKLKRIEI